MSIFLDYDRRLRSPGLCKTMEDYGFCMFKNTPQDSMVVSILGTNCAVCIHHQTHVQWQRHHALNLGKGAIREREREKEIFEYLKMKLLINPNPSSVVQASTYCRSISLHTLNCCSRHLELLALEFSRESCCCWGLSAHRLLREKRIEPSST